MIHRDGNSIGLPAFEGANYLHIDQMKTGYPVGDRRCFRPSTLPSTGWPRLALADAIRRRMAVRRNDLDIEEMPESWQRDLGFLDGRDRRCPAEEGAFRAARLIYSQRNL